MAKSSARIKISSPEDRLSEHLKFAEHHLIEAVKLFAKANKPERSKEYVKRLDKAQELVTGLFREELVRIRGEVRTKLRAVK
jgi:hypothetical protein